MVNQSQISDSKIAISGLYFFDETASRRAKELTSRARGEFEILDLLRSNLGDNQLNLEMLPRGTAWFDSGTFEDSHEVGTYVKLIQEGTGGRIRDPFEIVKIRGWLT